jgi:thiosulfate dehydrogenase
MDTIYYPVLWLVIAALVIGLLFIKGMIAHYRRLVIEDPRVYQNGQSQLKLLDQGQKIIVFFALFMLTGGVVFLFIDVESNRQKQAEMRQNLWPVYEKQKIWEAPDPFLAETDEERDLIRYGRDLIAHTQDYYGPYGLLRANSINDMNCQNCHLDAGRRPYGNNYFAVFSTYPQMRARSGALETVPKRINDCFQRSLNGEALDTNSREMRAMMAYMRWLGTGIPKGEKPKGSGLAEVPFLERPADPDKGQSIYSAKCASCHGPDGQGLPMPEIARDYPPLWGEKSYNEGAGLFRMSRFAAYVKANMPFGATYQNPQLTDEEAWDVAAFVNSQPRPKHPFLATDWPKIEKKPYDHPFGPYTDPFPEQQHKYGPFGPIVAFYKK